MDTLSMPVASQSQPQSPGSRTDSVANDGSTHNDLPVQDDASSISPSEPTSRNSADALDSSQPTTPTSAPNTASGDQATPQTPRNRQLNIVDAWSYVETVKARFSDRPDVYNQFLDIMKDFKGQIIDTPGVLQRVSTLFQGYPDLIQGFNVFTPPGYHITCTTDSSNGDAITTVTNPLKNGENEIRGDGVRPSTQIEDAFVFLKKIKTRFSNNPNTYSQFLEILRTYRREKDANPNDRKEGQLMREELHLVEQVEVLFQNQTDLVEEFKALAVM